MDFLDELPKRSNNDDTQTAAELAFNVAIKNSSFFMQSEDRKDYGTDVQIECRSNSGMTNFRVHVQLKGTEKKPNTDGSLSISVDRSNLNYLLNQPNSIYVVYHLQSKQLLVRYADDVFCQYEHRNPDWRTQSSVTVRFKQPFDGEFQSNLNAQVLALGRSTRNRRLEWTTTPPEQFPAIVEKNISPIEVPPDFNRAKLILAELYQSGRDDIISASFTRFSAVLDSMPGAMDKAYMAEINLALNNKSFDKSRVRLGIKAFKASMEKREKHPGSLLYCIGNGWLALQEYDDALKNYIAGLKLLTHTDSTKLAAMCSKNAGSALEHLGQNDLALIYYKMALEFNPDLAEAHFALGLYHCKNSNYSLALRHLDHVLPEKKSAIHMSAIQGWRIEILFNTSHLQNYEITTD